jgi:hypoxanthine phosphoribosyltransferase
MPVMDGEMIFTADLVREITLPLRIIPGKASIDGDATTSSETVTLPWGMPNGISGKDLLLLDDILDTGSTLNHLKKLLLQEGGRSVRTCILLQKESSRHLQADYLGFEIPNRFVIGYGMDYAGLYRNLTCIGVLNQETSREVT